MKYVSRLSLLILAMSLSGCLMTREEVAEEEQHKQVQQQVSSLQRNNADQQVRYTEINDEIRSLHGKIEAVDNRITTNSKEHDKVQAGAEAQIADNNKKLAAIQEDMQKLEGQIAYLTQEVIRLQTAKPAATVERMKAPAGKKADIFKSAEENFANKEWKQAILDYQKYREVSPSGKKFAMATYKIGLAFKNLGMKSEAKTFFEEVQNKFPDTTLAKQAKDQMKK